MKRALLSFGAGVIAAVSLPGAGWINTTWHLTPWTFLLFAWAVTILYLHLHGVRRRKTGPYFMHAYLWALGYFIFGLSWVGNALLIDGNPYAWAWPLALIGLPLLLSFFLGLTMLFGARLMSTAGPLLSPLIFAALFTVAELGRGYLFTGFPWNLPAMFWSDTLPMFQILAIIGPYGLSFLTIWWAVIVGQILLTRNLNPANIAIAVLSITGVIAFGTTHLNTPEPKPNFLNVALIQANIPQSEKWDGEKMPDHFYAHLQLTDRAFVHAAGQPVVAVWPETALPPNFITAPAAARELQAVLMHAAPGSAIISGALRMEGPRGQEKFYNGIVAYTLNAMGQIQVQPLYDKYHLVPFGEYIPFQKYIPIGPVAQFENMAAGSGPRTAHVAGLPPFRPLVCYEIIFPQALYTNRSDERWIINVTNDAWYGNSPGPQQHLAQARARAIERNLPVVRAAGTGISAVFDNRGNQLSHIPYDEKGFDFVSVPYYNHDQSTPYTRMGEVPLLLILGVIISVALQRASRHRSSYI